MKKTKKKRDLSVNSQYRLIDGPICSDLEGVKERKTQHK